MYSALFVACKYLPTHKLRFERSQILTESTCMESREKVLFSLQHNGSTAARVRSAALVLFDRYKIRASRISLKTCGVFAIDNRSAGLYIAQARLHGNCYILSVYKRVCVCDFARACLFWIMVINGIEYSGKVIFDNRAIWHWLFDVQAPPSKRNIHKHTSSLRSTEYFSHYFNLQTAWHWFCILNRHQYVMHIWNCSIVRRTHSFILTHIVFL